MLIPTDRISESDFRSFLGKSLIDNDVRFRSTIWVDFIVYTIILPSSVPTIKFSSVSHCNELIAKGLI